MQLCCRASGVCPFPWYTYHLYTLSLPVIDFSSCPVIIPDWAMCLIFWPRDCYNLSLGYLDEGPWCPISAFTAIM